MTEPDQTKLDARFKAIGLSKSRIQSGRQCHKRLWLELHEPASVRWGDAAQARLDEGTAFGELAQDLLGGGLLIEADHFHVREALLETRAALARPREEAPRLFEAAFEYEGVRVRVDALERGPLGDTLIEVKSTTQVKDEYLWDCAIQTWVVRGSGRGLRRILLAHADRGFVYTRKGDYEGLLVTEDITERVEALLEEIPDIVAKLKRVATGPKPRITTGAHCHHPYACPLLAHCQASEPAPPDYPVDVLPRGGELAQWLRREGYLDLRDVPDELLERALHKRVAAATRDDKPFVSSELAEILDAIAYPRFHLDFETTRFIVPRWLDMRPFEQLPFQFSCHVETLLGELRHVSFLDTSGHSPLAEFADRLVEVLGDKGPILVWNKGFEGACIRSLAARFPERRTALLRIVDRLVDLLPIYREHYYHRDMRGSWSIKEVLSTIAPELDYADLAVADGSTAQGAYLEAIRADTSHERQEELRSQLIDYCGRDTLAMVRLAHWRAEARAVTRTALDHESEGLIVADKRQSPHQELSAEEMRRKFQWREKGESSGLSLPRKDSARLPPLGPDPLPDESVCFNCVSQVWAVALGLGGVCRHPANRVNGQVFPTPSRRHTCLHFEAKRPDEPVVTNPSEATVQSRKEDQ